MEEPQNILPYHHHGAEARRGKQLGIPSICFSAMSLAGQFLIPGRFFYAGNASRDAKHFLRPWQFNAFLFTTALYGMFLALLGLALKHEKRKARIGLTMGVIGLLGAIASLFV